MSAFCSRRQWGRNISKFAVPAAVSENRGERRSRWFSCRSTKPRFSRDATDRLTSPRFGQSDVVHGMSGFVEDAHDSAQRIAITEARGDANVAGGAAGEGMFAFIEPATIERKTNRLHDLDGELSLFGKRKFARELKRRATHLQVDDFLNQPWQAAAECSKDGFDLRARKPRTELID